MAATMRTGLKSDRKMHEIEEESDDYSYDDVNEKDSKSNQIASSSRMNSHQKLKPVFKLKGVLVDHQRA